MLFYLPINIYILFYFLYQYNINSFSKKYAKTFKSPLAKHKSFLRPMPNNHLILAGGGHTHALILRRWAMKPDLRPQGLITLVNRSSRTLYSGMVPGLIAGYYHESEASLDLRGLANASGVAFVGAEIQGIDPIKNCLFLKDRPFMNFERLSLNVGSETFKSGRHISGNMPNDAIPIRPLEKSIKFIKEQDFYSKSNQSHPFTVIGSGFTGIEVVLALRRRWPFRKLQLQLDIAQLNKNLTRTLFEASIDLLSINDQIKGPTLFCTGSSAPAWLHASGLSTDMQGRVLTKDTLQLNDYHHLFAAGDCAVIQGDFRPPSGVWAVRAAKPLAQNLERCSKGRAPLAWRPQKRALQLLGGVQINSETPVALAFWGGFVLGPYSFLWNLKEAIDRRFMAKFLINAVMKNINSRDQDFSQDCRGCAAKIGAKTLSNSLEKVGLGLLGTEPKDSALIASSVSGEHVYQSVDGFPALISDPWLNGRITALHACSDLWASGLAASSAQVVITLPKEKTTIQQELLVQSLSGIQSALEPQGAKIVGGHTLESRSSSPLPCSLGIQISLSVNGIFSVTHRKWSKSGLEDGDVILISRSLGTGVLFNAAMIGKACTKDLDFAVEQLFTSQYQIFDSLRKMELAHSSRRVVHACTDITGFGLLAHLGEMLKTSNIKRENAGDKLLRITLDLEKIPALPGALSLLDSGYSSSLAPANRSAWDLLEPSTCENAPVELSLGEMTIGSKEYKQIKDLIVDPQTCGPLVISCEKDIAKELVELGPWKKIGDIRIH